MITSLSKSYLYISVRDFLTYPRWVDKNLNPAEKVATLTAFSARLVGDLDFCRAAICQQMSQKIRTQLHEPRHQWGQYWPPHTIGSSCLCCTYVFLELQSGLRCVMLSTVTFRSICVALFT